jgi:hypothetical protein
MTFRQLLEALQNVDDKDLDTEACGFEGGKFQYWVSHLSWDERGKLGFEGTVDV